MKIVWNLKSIPEFEGLDKYSAKEKWMEMYSQVRASGECKSVPIATGLIAGSFMFLVIAGMSFLPRPSDVVRFFIMITSAGIGGYLGGVFAMSLNYRSGRKHLKSQT